MDEFVIGEWIRRLRAKLDDDAAVMGWGYAASIALVVVGVFVGLPTILGTFRHPVMGWGLIVILVPIIPALCVIFQRQARLRALWWLYLGELAGLLFDLFFILMILPVIGGTIFFILMGVVAVAIVLGSIAWAIQEWLGIYLGVGVSGRDVLGYLGILAGLLVGGGLLYFLAQVLKGPSDSLLDAFVDLRLRVRAAIEKRRRNL